MPSAASPSTVGRMIRSSTFSSMLCRQTEQEIHYPYHRCSALCRLRRCVCSLLLRAESCSFSIGQNEYGTFYTAQEFFNHYGGGSVTEHSAQHFFNSSLASSKVGRISTPFPAQRPSAFSTYGASNVSRKANPSSRFAAVILL